MPKFLMTMQLQTQGKLRGSVKSKGGGSNTSGTLEIDSFSFGVANPATNGNSSGGGSGKETQNPFNSIPGSGTPSSKAQQKPIRIVKQVDSASPQLYHALVTNELIQSATFQFYKSGTGGKEQIAQTVTITNGTITGYQRYTPVNGKPHEVVTVAYQELAVNGARFAAIPLSLLKHR